MDGQELPRTGQENNPLALGLVLGEAERLISTGEPLYDVLEAFAEPSAGAVAAGGYHGSRQGIGPVS